MLWYVSYGTFFKPCFISLEYVIYRPQIRECQIRDIWSPAKKSARHIFFPFDLKNVESTILLFFHSNPKNYISSYNNMLLIARSTISFISRTPPDSTFFKANEKKNRVRAIFCVCGRLYTRLKYIRTVCNEWLRDTAIFTKSSQAQGYTVKLEPIRIRRSRSQM